MSTNSQEESPRSSDDGHSLHSVSQRSLEDVGSSDSNFSFSDSDFSSPSDSERYIEEVDNTGRVYENHPDAYDTNLGPGKHVTSRDPEEYVADMTAPGREAAERASTSTDQPATQESQQPTTQESQQPTTQESQ
ncbi:hypothetical protein PMIN01_04655 [Paraphaeosphaeria minitans]|uniref:Uncharacterized protein n=1 Tax=Paraphaeosphaeria minitans TaxID=565426 RepID=A0A9P6GKJ2_9PLEO|nr:hypothetical protein PMIN01_04655 [Paraphaeosphaeria minitans]